MLNACIYQVVANILRATSSIRQAKIKVPYETYGDAFQMNYKKVPIENY